MKRRQIDRLEVDTLGRRTVLQNIAQYAAAETMRGIYHAARDPTRFRTSPAADAAEASSVTDFGRGVTIEGERIARHELRYPYEQPFGETSRARSSTQTTTAGHDLGQNETDKPLSGDRRPRRTKAPGDTLGAPWAAAARPCFKTYH
ncbi:hypothetical protein EVAR_96923_1 [Eumeta japonica]|uniref:Uncharacterized protein n=1 Tax=Eumeta variegata TaxID=151549 RepID=A0A4C2A9N5_EUMVA|nr:hypothetical protein EVAR_96923_1 [Eumeta japonica]